MTASLSLLLGLTACGGIKDPYTANTPCTKDFADAYNETVANIESKDINLKNLKDSCQRLASASGPSVCQGMNNGQIIWASKSDLDPICNEVL